MQLPNPLDRFREWRQAREDGSDPGTEPTSRLEAVAPEDTPWRYRNPQAFKRLLAACGLGVVALAAVLVVVLRPFDTTPDKVQAALSDSRVAVLDTAVDVKEAEKLKEIREAGRQAETRIPVIDRSIAAVRATNDLRYERPALVLLEAEKRYLEAVASTQELTDRKLRRWKKMRVEATVEKKKVGAVTPLIAALDVGEQGEVLPTTAQMEAPLVYLDDTITAAAKKIGPWLKRLYIAKLRKKMELQAMGEYGTSMDSGDREYTAMRDDTQAWADSVEANGSSYEDAYMYLYEAREKRIALRDALDSAQRPADVEDEHQALIEILNESITLIEDAGYGITDEATGYEDDYRDSEGWQNFQSGSDTISGSWPAAMQALRNELASAKRKVQARKLPKRPDV